MKRVFLLLAAVTMALAFTQCGKRGPIGPQGPQGPQGPPGSGGGISGAFSVTFQVPPEGWGRDVNADGVVSYTTELPLDEIDDDIFDNGAVMVYLYSENENSFWYEALPETFSGITYGVFYTVGAAYIDYHALDGSDPGAPTGDTYFKVVIIPATAIKAHPNVNLKNYLEVQKVFSIK